ncbi:MAG: high frequency lysogenization protein HflD [Spongiibacteraceae bacterium]
MSTTADTSQTLALAGILQSAYLVDMIARTGEAPVESLNPSINSLFKFNVETSEQVFGGCVGVKLGLQLLSDILGNSKHQQYSRVIRYALGILYLERKLSKNHEMLSIIRSRLEHAALKAEHFSDSKDSSAASIAAIYQDTISTFNYRLQISGSIQQLQNSKNTDNIRSLLFAGIRAAILWRQTGGKRWHLLMSRRRLLKTARELLQQL